jgi:hypothetical protein
MSTAGGWRACCSARKAPGETAGAFRRACTVLGGFPKTLYSDEGGEFAGAFDALAREHGVQRVIRDPRHTNALAVVDSLIGRVRRAMAREMVESGSESWVGAFRKACDAMNRRPLDHLLGARPVDVEHNPELRYSLNYQAGEEARQLTGQLEAQEARLRQAGAFRTLLPRGRFDKTGKPRWSAEVHQLAGIEHGWAVGTDGARERVRFTLPVGKDSRSVRLPQAVAGGDNARDALRREKLKPYIEALAAHLGAARCMCSRRGVPGEARGLEGGPDRAAAEEPEPAADPGAVPGAEGRGQLCEPVAT